METSLSFSPSNNDVYRWDLIIYRVPTEPASKRVCIWRELKRLGALSLQQCVVILPHLESLNNEIETIKKKIIDMGGEVMHIPIPALLPADEEKTIRSFREQRDKEFQEILEECQSHFVREVEFERFRKNFTYEAVEEAEQNLEKIKRWYNNIVERDWFHADLQTPAAQCIAGCQTELEQFEREVFEKENAPASTDIPPSGPDAA
ncbi:MAG: hypothetical protein LWX83_03830 [Anaerolineae bacterium]|nr:hypothetical protein [Anaerolineae bacterium]